MNIKTLFRILPMALVIGAFAGCDGKIKPTPTIKELTKLVANVTRSSGTYYVDEEFNKADLNVVATWSDGSINTVKDEDYTVSPDLPHVFTSEEVGSKNFTITYLNKSTDVIVTVKSETDKDKFVRILNDWTSGEKGFLNSTAEYTVDQVKLKYNGVEKDLKYIGYYKDSEEGFEFRYCDVCEDENPSASSTYYDVAASYFDGTYYKDALKDASTYVKYEFNNDYISYIDDDPAQGEYAELKFNKYGYIVSEKIHNGHQYEFTYADKPKELKSASIEYDNLQSTLQTEHNIILDSRETKTTRSIKEGKSNKIKVYLNATNMKEDTTTLHLALYDKNKWLLQTFDEITVKKGLKEEFILGTLDKDVWNEISSNDELYIDIYTEREIEMDLVPGGFEYANVWDEALCKNCAFKLIVNYEDESPYRGVTCKDYYKELGKKYTFGDASSDVYICVTSILDKDGNPLTFETDYYFDDGDIEFKNTMNQKVTINCITKKKIYPFAVGTYHFD